MLEYNANCWRCFINKHIKKYNNLDFVSKVDFSIHDYIKKPLIIKNLRLPNRLALAPLAGTTETVFRSICREMGVGLVTTELVSARGIYYDPSLKKNYQYLEIDPEKENPVAIQLFGHCPNDFRRSVEIILRHPVLQQCAMVDINMGCPVKKVVKEGAGSALMKTPQLASDIVKTVVEVAKDYDKPVSVKFRSGWDEETKNAPDFAIKMQEAGADLITIHGRSREQFYSGLADWTIVKQVVDAVDIPVYGNGDLIDLQSIKKMYEETNCSGFVIGRAAQGNPWIFREIMNGNGLMNKKEWLDMIKRHVNGRLLKEKEEGSTIIKMRKQFLNYLKGKKNAAQIRRKVMTCESKDELFKLLDEIEIS